MTRNNSHLYKKVKASFQLFYRTVLNPQVFPFWSYINLTRTCNLSCPYCYVLDDAIPDMSITDVIGVVNKLAELKTQWVSFTGGEPTLVKETLLAGVEHASLRKKMFTQLPTNGHLLDESYLMQLGEAGLDLIDISLDALEGSNSKKGLADRRPELFDAVFKARSKYNMVVKVNTVITKENIHKINDLLKFTKLHDVLLSARLGFKAPATKTNPLDDSNGAGLLDDSDIQRVREVAQLLKSAKSNGYLITEPSSYFDLWAGFVGSDHGYQHWGCEASTYNLNIDPNGMLRVCNNLPVNKGQVPLHYSRVTKDYFRVLGENIDDIKKQCQPSCLAAAYYCSQHYRKHPHHFMLDKFFSRY